MRACGGTLPDGGDNVPAPFKPVERVLEAGDGPEWRDSDGEIDLLGPASALNQSLVAVVVTTVERFAGTDEI